MIGFRLVVLLIVLPFLVFNILLEFLLDLHVVASSTLCSGTYTTLYNKILDYLSTKKKRANLGVKKKKKTN